MYSIKHIYKRNVSSLVLPYNYYTIPPNIYDKQFWWKKDDIEFWKNLFNQQNNKRVLELAAGTGRLGIPLAREGVDYTGLEISSDYCKHANQILSQFNNETLIYKKDMRNFDLNNNFDNIFIGFNSWLHLLTNKDVEGCLKSVKKHMTTESCFYIDILMPNPLFLYRPKDVALRVLEFEDNHYDMVYVDELLDYNKDKEIANITWIYSNQDKKELFNFQFQMKMYYPDTMNKILIDSGFNINSVWGCYNQTKLSENSMMQIYKCTI